MNNRFAQSADLESRRWWWPPAVAGVAASAAIAAIAVVPLAGHAKPMEETRYEAPFSPGTDTGRVGPCFMVRPRWNVALDGPQPTCTRWPSTAGHDDTEALQAPRPRPNAYLGA